MQTFWQDLRFGVRMLFKKPGFTFIIIATLALGIGATTAIFSLFDQVMLRRLPVERPDELVILRAPGPARGRMSSDGDNATSFSYRMYKGLRERNAMFANLLARYAIPLSVSASGQTERASGELVSGNYFATLGVAPALGRTFTLDDDQQLGAHPLAVLSHAYWLRRFGGAATVLNQTILVNGHSLTVVGVTRAGFNGVQVGQSPDIFVPLTMAKQMMPNRDGMEDWNDFWLAVIGRLKPGFNAAQAEAAVLPIYQALLAEQAETLKDWAADRREAFLKKKLELKPGERGRTVFEADNGEGLNALFGMVALVLLITCVNIANLLLVRGLGRRRELAIRHSLGAGRGRLIRQLLIESLLLAGLGGLLGLLLAQWLSAALVQAIAGAEGLSATLDSRALAFTFAVTLLTGLAFGLLPAWQATRGDMMASLKDQSTSASFGRGHARWRKSLVTAQIALTMLLLVGAGLLTRTLMNLSKANLGMRTEQMVTFSVAPELSGYSPARTVAFGDQLSDALAAVPGVQAVAASEIQLLAGSNMGSNITTEGMEQLGNIESQVNQNFVSPSFFSAMGIALVGGREFTGGDNPKAPKVVIINETLAKRFFPNRNPVGTRMTFGGGNVKLDHEIVGVVKDSRYSQVRSEPPPVVYQPYAQEPALGELHFYVRAAQRAAVIPALRAAVKNLDANLPIYDEKTFDGVIAENLFGERLLAFLSVSFGGLAALLAGLGLYGVLAWTVAQRTREIGIRVALGATPGTVRWMILRQGLWLTLTGIALGLVAGFGFARLLSSLLYQVKPADLLTYVASATLLTGVTLLACWLPAYRAAKTDPLVALRCE